MAELGVAVFSVAPEEREALDRFAADPRLVLHCHDTRLRSETAALAAGCRAVSCTTRDDLGTEVLERLHDLGVGLVALRCVGFNNVNTATADRLGIAIARVPSYPPHAVAEHCIALVMSLARGIHRAYNRVREGDVSLVGLVGCQLHDATVAVIGTGRIGSIVARILAGFGCRVLACDPVVNPTCRVNYADLRTCLAEAEVVSLHCPLTPRTVGLVGEREVDAMRPGAILVNTSRGGLIDLEAVGRGLESGRLGGLGLDLYEEDEGLYFSEPADSALLRPELARLLRHPGVLITVHQACCTRQALDVVAETTIANLLDFARGGPGMNVLATDLDQA